MSLQDQNSSLETKESYGALALVSLRYRAFRLVWLGSVSEHMGEFMELAAVLWLVNELTHSPLMLTLVGSAKFIPLIFFPILGGVIADRVDRKLMLMISLVGSGLLSICLAILSVTGLIAVWHLFLIGLLGGIAMSFNHPARQTIVPNLIKKEHLLNAISLDFISVQGSRMVGMLLAGYLIVILGIWPIFVLRSLGCLLAIFWLTLAPVPSTPISGKKRTMGQDFVEGFAYLRSNTIIFVLVILYLIPWLTSNTFTSFLPIFAKDILDIGAVGYGYMQAAPGLGAIASLVGLTFFTYYKKKATLLVTTGILMGIGLIGFSVLQWAPASLMILVVVGAMLTAFSTVNSTLIQGAVRDEYRGRVISWREVAFGLGPTGSLLFGTIAQFTGVQISLGLLGLIIMIPAILLIFQFHRFNEIL